ncbi:MAG: pentapeptide repeat-containing protein [Desulfobacteraceae bacterium]|nr:pentapeptide repeat-containing protein [Desulfobacteraceae bacterium]
MIQAHIDILNKGVRNWNKWREKNSRIFPDLNEADLIGADLSGANFRGVNLSEANLNNTSLWGTDLRAANLICADLVGSNLSGSNLAGANLRRADLRGANLIESDLRGVNLRKADLRDARLRTAYLRKANLWGADIRGANLSETNLIKADLRGADLREANLSYAYLIRTNLTGANISGVILFGAARDDWKIDRIKCDYVYFGLGRERREPADRDFDMGEFEDRFNKLPTIEYYFKNGFTAADAYIMEQVVLIVKQKNPEFELKLDSFLLRGRPRAVFSILHRDYADNAYKQIKNCFETRVKGQRKHVTELLSMIVC